MNKTIALFVTVMIVLITSCVYAYATMPKYSFPEVKETVEEVKEEPVTEKKYYEPVIRHTPSKTKEESPYKYDYPFYGMEEEYVEKTILGKADKVDSDYDFFENQIIVTTTYVWLNYNGTYRAYAIVGDSVFDEGKRIVYNFTDCSKKKYYSSDKSSSKSDPYNAKDYGYADDFYDEYYDDFYDYEDAEDYWMWNQ